MAQMSSALFLSLLLLLIYNYNPRAHATLISPVQGLLITGQLCCTSAGNCPGSPAAGAVVTVSCLTLLGIRSGLGQNTTDVNGFFSVTVPAAAGLIFGLPQIPCLVKVRLPLNATVCPLLSTTTGVIDGILTSVGTVASGLLGTLRTANVTLFVKVTV